MTIIDLIRVLVHDSPIAVIITDAAVARPGPTILYANTAFGLLTGRTPSEVIGLSPHFMQGRETRQATLDAFSHALKVGERFHGYVTNYRANGAKYRVEIDCRPLLGANGQIENFIAFQREVVRRVGRPGSGPAGRYEPAFLSNDLLTDALREMGVFDAAAASITQSPAKF